MILYVLIVCTWNQNKNYYQWGKKNDQVLKLSQEIEQIAVWKSRCRERPILSCHKCGTRKKILSSHKESNLKPWDKCKALIFLHFFLQVQNIPSFIFYLQMLKVSQEKSPHPQKKIKLFLKLKAKFKVVVMRIQNSNI